MADNATRGSRETIFFNVGHQGRRTGITVEDTGKRDEHGFEPMDNFFSPEKMETPQPPPPTAPKPAPAAGGVLRSSSAIPSSTGVNQTATDGSMAVAESSGVEPQEARALQMRQASLPPTTSRAPGKFTVSGSPIRGSSIGPRSSPTRQLDSSPIRSSSPNKKLDFGIAKRAESVSSVLGSPTRKPIAPAKVNGRATSVGPAVPEKQDVVRPREREMSNPPREYEPTKPVAPVAPMATNLQPVKRPQVVGKIIEEDEMMDDSAVAQSSPVQKKKSTKRGLVSARPAANPITFDDNNADEELGDTTKANGDITNGRDAMEEAASEFLDSTLVSSRNVEVVMPNAPVGEDPQMDELPAPAPVKTKQTAKPRKALTPELQPQSKKPTKSSKMSTSEPESEAETEELEPVKFQGKKRPEQKKTIPTSAPELTPEEGGDDATQDTLEPKASQKRPAAKKPHPAKKMVSAKAKVAPKAEPEPELAEEDEEDIDEDDLEPKRFSFQKRSATKPVAAKGKKVQPRPEPETDKVQDKPVARESKSRTAKTAPAKKVAPVPEPEPEVEEEEEEQEVAASITRPNGKSAPGKGKQSATVPEAEMEPEAEQEETEKEASPAKKQSKPRKKLTMKTTSRATKKNVPQPALELDAEVEEGEEAQPAPVPKKRGGKAAKKVPTPEPEEDDDEPMLEPAKPAPKRKGRGKAKVVEEEPEPEPEPVKLPTTAKSNRKKVAEEPEPEPELKKPATKSKGRGKVPSPPNPELSELSSQPTRRPSTAKAKLKDTPQDDEEPPKKKARSGGKAPKLSMPSRVSPRKRGHAPARRAVPSPEDEQAPMDADEMEVDAPPPRKGKGKGKAPAKTAPTIASGPPIAKETRGTQRVIREKPPQAPGQQSGGVEGTRRSARARVAPLQYWKGEKAEYALADIDQDNPRMKSIRMPQLVGVVRIESDEEQKPKRRAPAPKKKAPSAGAKRKRTLDGEGSDDSDAGEPDVWERSGSDDEVGVKKGKVRAYPAIEDEDEAQMEEVQLAFSKHRMVTVGVANGDFKFVKTFTDEHFGTGIIEILPGGTKRFKSSGKMYLVFYILKGRVAVTIAKTNFRIGKGGQFMVPRGNLYSIENEYDTPAKMFFAQGCAPDIYEDEDA